MEKQAIIEKIHVQIIKDKDAVGCGFFISENIILTCAHVVNSALGRSNDIHDKPSEESIVKFKLSFDTTKEIYNSKIKEWVPHNGKDGKDLVLLITEDTTVTSLDFCYGQLTSGKRSNCKTYGVAIGESAFWVHGTILEDMDGRGFFQFQSDQSLSSVPIVKGFSGAPVVNKKNDKIVGVVTSNIISQRGPENIAYIIPITFINESFSIKVAMENSQNTNKFKDTDLIDLTTYLKIKDDFDSLLKLDAQKHYSKAREYADLNQWKESFHEHYIAHSIFLKTGDKIWAARGAGRLAWICLALKSHEDYPKEFLKLSESLDKIQSTANYFEAIQYSLRNNDEKFCEYLSDKFVELCLDLDIFSIDEIRSLDNDCVLNIIYKFYKILIEQNKTVNNQIISCSDIGRLHLIESLISKDGNRTLYCLTNASQHFRDAKLHSYVVFCEINKKLLQLEMLGSFQQIKKSLEELIVLYRQIDTQLSNQLQLNNKVNKGVINLLKINIKLLDYEKLAENDLNKIRGSLNGIPRFGVEQQDLICNILIAIDNLKISGICEQKIKDVLPLFYQLYRTTPGVYGNYTPLISKSILKIVKEHGRS